MSRPLSLTFEFVEFIPRTLAQNVLYISPKYATAIHLCCSCYAHEVVTPFSPADWKLIFDGDTVTFSPSIGNWNFPCQSHYWITRNEVRWDRQWSRREIDAARLDDEIMIKSHSSHVVQTAGGGPQPPSWLGGIFRRVKQWLGLAPSK